MWYRLETVLQDKNGRYTESIIANSENRPMWNFSKLLGISSYEVTKFYQDRECIFVQLHPRRITAACTTCGKISSRVKSYGKEQSIQHGTILGKMVYIFVRRRRFLCRACKRVFSEDHPLLKVRQRATMKHKKEVVLNLSDRSFSAGTKKYHVSYFTQRKWLNDVISQEVLNFKHEEQEGTPFVLGIDEVSFAGRDMVITIGNITKHRLKGVLHSKRKDELKKVLRSLSPKVKSLIAEVVIDMCNLYLKAVKETLPNVEIVIDHFHVIQDANRRIDQERLLLQDIFKKKIPRYIFTKNKEDLNRNQPSLLADIVKKYPELTMFYQTKERLRDMYRSRTKEEATDKLRTIILSLTSTDDGELITWGRTLSYWKQYILNYWNSRSTNGFMEGIHNKMKLIKRISFGFRNKQVFIHKVMLSVLVATLLLPQLNS